MFSNGNNIRLCPPTLQGGAEEPTGCLSLSLSLAGAGAEWAAEPCCAPSQSAAGEWWQALRSPGSQKSKILVCSDNERIPSRREEDRAQRLRQALCCMEGKSRAAAAP